MPEGFPRWQNAAGEKPGEDERFICPVCEDQTWVGILAPGGGSETAVPCRWCESGYEYIEAEILDSPEPDVVATRIESWLYELDAVVGVSDELRAKVEARKALAA